MTPPSFRVRPEPIADAELVVELLGSESMLRSAIETSLVRTDFLQSEQLQPLPPRVISQLLPARWRFGGRAFGHSAVRRGDALHEAKSSVRSPERVGRAVAQKIRR
jgi:hypothetical protein